MKPKKIVIEFELDHKWESYSDCSDEVLYEDVIALIDPPMDARLVKVGREKEGEK